MADTTARGAGLAERARHAGEDGPAPERRRRMREVDAAQLPLMLTTLRLPTIDRLWHSFAERADREGWGAARYLAALCEHELAERTTRRIARHLAQSRSAPGQDVRHL
jgi:hypothetical protein